MGSQSLYFDQGQAAVTLNDGNRRWYFHLVFRTRWLANAGWARACRHWLRGRSVAKDLSTKGSLSLDADNRLQKIPAQPELRPRWRKRTENGYPIHVVVVEKGVYF